jgi:hypothetical protein
MSFLELTLRVREHEQDSFANGVSEIVEAQLKRLRDANSGYRSHDLRVCALNVFEKRVDLSVGSHALLTLSEGLKRRLFEKCYILLKQECMLSKVHCTANDGLGALKATTSQAWYVVMGAQGSHQLSGASSPF